tara:strand:+ start:812 stop:985 length:174 start_codon:yes stop_codon:yes gene_type:complete
MTLYEKIKSIYPQLTTEDFNSLLNGAVMLQNDSDGKGDYIAAWAHPTYAKPTEEQLA